MRKTFDCFLENLNVKVKVTQGKVKEAAAGLAKNGGKHNGGWYFKRDSICDRYGGFGNASNRHSDHQYVLGLKWERRYSQDL